MTGQPRLRSLAVTLLENAIALVLVLAAFGVIVAVAYYLSMVVFA